MSRKKSTVKGSYRRSTPVIRLRRNVDKIVRHAALCKDRLDIWKASTNSEVEGAIKSVEAILELVKRLAGHVDRLVSSGFVPPRRIPAWQPAKGDRVRVVDDHRLKYEEAFASVLKSDPEMLDDLVVVETLSSGEVSVQRGRKMPFLVRKSHLSRRAEAA